MATTALTTGCADALHLHLENLSIKARHAFKVALLLDSNVEPVMWMYRGEYQGKFIFQHKVTARKVTV